MSIEQHTGPDPHDGPDPTPAPTATPTDAGAALARLLHGLTTAVPALPADDFGPHTDTRDHAESPETDEAPAAPVRERRTGSLLAELTFLDD